MDTFPLAPRPTTSQPYPVLTMTMLPYFETKVAITTATLVLALLAVFGIVASHYVSLRIVQNSEW